MVSEEQLYQSCCYELPRSVDCVLLQLHKYKETTQSELRTHIVFNNHTCVKMYSGVTAFK